MHRMRLSHLLLATLLAVILPLEQVHCACNLVGMRAVRASAVTPACHGACCASHAASHRHHARPGGDKPTCACERLASANLPMAPALAAADAQSVPPIAPVPFLDSIEPGVVATHAVPALDVGSPPLPVDAGAHGLRAPPASA